MKPGKFPVFGPDHHGHVHKNLLYSSILQLFRGLAILKVTGKGLQKRTGGVARASLTSAPHNQITLLLGEGVESW